MFMLKCLNISEVSLMYFFIHMINFYHNVICECFINVVVFVCDFIFMYSVMSIFL